MNLLKKNVGMTEDNFCRFQTAMVEIRYSNARSDIENSNASAQEYKMLSLNLMDEASREGEDNKNHVIYCKGVSLIWKREERAREPI